MMQRGEFSNWCWRLGLALLLAVLSAHAAPGSTDKTAEAKKDAEAVKKTDAQLLDEAVQKTENAMHEVRALLEAHPKGPDRGVPQFDEDSDFQIQFNEVKGLLGGLDRRFKTITPGNTITLGNLVRAKIYGTTPLLSTKQFKKDLQAVERMVADNPRYLNTLQALGYHTLAAHFGTLKVPHPPKAGDGLEAVPFSAPMTESRRGLAPVARSATGQPETRSDLGSFMKDNLKEGLQHEIALTKIWRQLSGRARLNKQIAYAVYTAVVTAVGGGAIMSGMIPTSLINWARNSPFRAFLAIVGAFQGNHLLHNVLTTQLFPKFYMNFLKATSEREYEAAIEGWNAIVKALPVQGAQLRVNAAMENQVSLETLPDLPGEATRDNIMRDISKEGNDGLVEIGRASIINGHTDRATEAFEELLDREQRIPDEIEFAKKRLAVLKEENPERRLAELAKLQDYVSQELGKAQGNGMFSQLKRGKEVTLWKRRQKSLKWLRDDLENKENNFLDSIYSVLTLQGQYSKKNIDQLRTDEEERLLKMQAAIPDTAAKMPMVKAVLEVLKVKERADKKLWKIRVKRALVKAAIGLVAAVPSLHLAPLTLTTKGLILSGISSYIGWGRLGNLALAAPNSVTLARVFRDENRDMLASMRRLMAIDKDGRMVGAFANYYRKGDPLDRMFYARAARVLAESDNPAATMVLVDSVKTMVARKNKDLDRILYQGRHAVKAVSRCIDEFKAVAR